MPPTGTDSVTDGCQTQAWAGAFRSGRAWGRLYGEKLEKERAPFYADLYTYASAGTWVCNERIDPDGTYTVEIRERLR